MTFQKVMQSFLFEDDAMGGGSVRSMASEAWVLSEQISLLDVVAGGCRLIQVMASLIAVSSPVLLLLLATPWYSGSAMSQCTRSYYSWRVIAVGRSRARIPHPVRAGSPHLPSGLLWDPSV